MENNILKKYDTKSWLKSAILGFLIGLAVIIPGVSGSTIAIMFSLYTALLYAFGNIFKSFKACVVFLLPIALGIVIGFLLGFLVIQRIYDIAPFMVSCLFAGLMAGAFPIVFDEIKPFEKSNKSFTLIIIGAIVPVALGIASILLSGGVDVNATYSGFPWWIFPLYLVLGYVMAITQIVPGLSATCILMAVGQFRLIMNALHREYLMANPIVILLFFTLAVGFVIGIVSFSKVLNGLFSKNKKTTFTVIVGLSLGSIVSMFVNPEIFNVYKGWGTSSSNALLDIIVGVVLFVVGFTASYLLVRYERKHKKEIETAEQTAKNSTSNTIEK